jgi:hypothetical protein
MMLQTCMSKGGWESCQTAQLSENHISVQAEDEQGTSI